MSVTLGNKFCSACGNELLSTAVVCPKCGSPTSLYRPSTSQPGKSKTTAVLLAVFLGIWSWLYTYDVNKRKFWIALGVYAVLTGLFFIAAAYFMYRRGLGFYPETSELVISGIVNASWLLSPLAFAIWAIIDNSSKSASWYENYPSKVGR